MMHRPNGVGGRVDRNLDWIVQVMTNQVSNVAVKCRREQHGLRTASAVAEDPFHLRSKSIVSHTIRFVKTDNLDIAEIHFI